MKRHVEFLSTLYLAWGAIFALVAIAGFALAGGAFAIAHSSGPVRFGSEMAARLTGVTIAIISVISLVWAALHLVVECPRHLVERVGKGLHRVQSPGLDLGNDLRSEEHTSELQSH